MSGKSEELIYEGENPLRLDRYLAHSFEGISRSYLQEMIEKKLVRVNDRIAKKGDLLSSGDRIFISPFVHPDERRIEPNGDIRLHIVHEGKNFVVVDKPPGLPTHPNDFADCDTFANALLSHYPEVSDVGEDHLRPGIVHRLDSDTSGLIIAARNQSEFARLRALFDERKIQKTYWAMVLGDITQEGEITTPIAHHPKNPRKMMAVTKQMKIGSRLREARTLYRPLEKFGLATLLEVKTLTGRMHQVRVHLSSIGHPLLGDRLYQSPKERAMDRFGLDRHFLHAIKLVVPDRKGKKITFTSQLPQDLQRIVDKMGREYSRSTRQHTVTKRN